MDTDTVLKILAVMVIVISGLMFTIKQLVDLLKKKPGELPGPPQPGALPSSSGVCSKDELATFLKDNMPCFRKEKRCSELAIERIDALETKLDERDNIIDAVRRIKKEGSGETPTDHVPKKR